MEETEGKASSFATSSTPHISHEILKIDKTVIYP